jgi:hypothetical protein
MSRKVYNMECDKDVDELGSLLMDEDSDNSVIDPDFNPSPKQKRKYVSSDEELEEEILSSGSKCYIF